MYLLGGFEPPALSLPSGPSTFSSHFSILRDPDIYPLTALHTAHIKGLGKILHKLEINCCQVLANHFFALASLFTITFSYSRQVSVFQQKFYDRVDKEAP